EGDGNVRSSQECLERFDRNLIQRAVGGLPHFLVAVAEQVHENRQLLRRPGRDRALRRQQPHFARNFSAGEEVEQRRRPVHRTAMKSLRVSGVTRVVTVAPFLPSGRPSPPFTETVTAPASPATSTNSCPISMLRCSPARTMPSMVFTPSTVAEIQQ